MNMPKPKDKSFAIPKQLVWEAWRQVKANKGAPGVDGQALEEFESDLKNQLYRIWNRMSSGTYFPPPIRAVEIPKGLSINNVLLSSFGLAVSAGQDLVVPLGVEVFAVDVDGFRFGVCDFDLGWVCAFVEAGVDLQAAAGCG